jgi:hypothetical protein
VARGLLLARLRKGKEGKKDYGKYFDKIRKIARHEGILGHGGSSSHS